MKMNHVGISVADIERSVAFYCDMLGMEQASPVFPFAGPDFEEIMALDGAQGRMCVVSTGDLHVELFEFSAPAPSPKDPAYSVGDRGISHFGIEVADIDSAYRRLSEAGVLIHSPIKTFPGGTKAIYARDPDGNVFELVESSKSAEPSNPLQMGSLA